MDTTRSERSDGPVITRFDSTATIRPAPEDLPANLPDEQRERARHVEHKKLFSGPGGFFVMYEHMPAGVVLEPHSHDFSELMVILEGSIRLSGDDGQDGAELPRYDSVVVPAGCEFGYTVGSEGLSYILVRTREDTEASA